MGSLPKVRVGIGECSHRFLSGDSTKPCILAGIIFEDSPGLAANSDGDVVLSSLCNAITTLSGVDILKGIANDLLHKDGITDSQVYLEKALVYLGNQKIQHVAISIEAKRPGIEALVFMMRQKIADILKMPVSAVGISSYCGDGLTDVSCGDGVHCTSLITTVEA